MVGETVYNTEQRRKMLKQIKEYLDEQWLKRKVQGRLSKKIILPGAEPIKTTRKRKKRKTKKKIRVFKVFKSGKYSNQFVVKEVKKRKNKRYKK